MSWLLQQALMEPVEFNKEPGGPDWTEQKVLAAPTHQANPTHSCDTGQTIKPVYDAYRAIQVVKYNTSLSQQGGCGTRPDLSNLRISAGGLTTSPGRESKGFGAGKSPGTPTTRP